MTFQDVNLVYFEFFSWFLFWDLAEREKVNMRKTGREKRKIMGEKMEWKEKKHLFNKNYCRLITIHGVIKDVFL